MALIGYHWYQLLQIAWRSDEMKLTQLPVTLADHDTCQFTVCYQFYAGDYTFSSAKVSLVQYGGRTLETGHLEALSSSVTLHAP